ncbi:rhodanese-like domain-containing protein [Subtercola boreus]|uniref:rhodanese-like domain-containing protein n=1 Tax=Subtercola boreus TaxID=120213 RepID=UPI001474C1FA|nr:rhodanese-like domain-containing protein [Subtercola boreus]
MISSAAFPTPPATRPAVSPSVSTQWLCDHLGSDTMVVLDGRGFGRAAGPSEARCSRIPTALFADGFAAADDASFREITLRYGIDSSSTVVLYDAGAGSKTAGSSAGSETAPVDDAARLRDVFRSFGHERVTVLDGGFAKWNAEERPTESAADSSAA